MRFIFLFILGLLGTQSLVQAYPLLQCRSGNIIRRTSPEPSSTHLPGHERLKALRAKWDDLGWNTYPIMVELRKQGKGGGEIPDAYTSAMDTIGRLLDSENPQLEEVSKLLHEAEGSSRLLHKRWNALKPRRDLLTWLPPYTMEDYEKRLEPQSDPPHVVNKGSLNRPQSSTRPYSSSGSGSSHRGGPSQRGGLSQPRLSNAHRSGSSSMYPPVPSHPPGIAPAPPSSRRTGTPTPGYADLHPSSSLQGGPSQPHLPNAHRPPSPPYPPLRQLYGVPYAPPGLNPSSLPSPSGPSSLYTGSLPHQAPQSHERPSGNPLQHPLGGSFRDLLGPPIDFGSPSGSLQPHPNPLHPQPNFHPISHLTPSSSQPPLSQHLDPGSSRASYSEYP